MAKPVIQNKEMAKFETKSSYINNNNNNNNNNNWDKSQFFQKRFKIY